MVGYAYGSEDDESGQILFSDMLNHPKLHRLCVILGGRLPPGNIVCDGLSVEIGGELHRVMRRIRSQDEVLRIWVDALCIEQGNLKERN